MANYIVSYDLNGPHPSHPEMDQHIAKLTCPYARVLETVWYIGYPGTRDQLVAHLRSILGTEDLLLVVLAQDATWTKLLVDSESLKAAWIANSGG